ncbi:unnamed protein product [Cyprideis torosa]|uniref:Uncharacterized protein n=1 Tax=Cyprideis torosa TaxID=163714 RepID=A0A7R8W556_9CRUS|nr:unnamed protein product [Cyprideis torosa]CAG0884811.1 unnamed protein product [Cyprideis torosa]
MAAKVISEKRTPPRGCSPLINRRRDDKDTRNQEQGVLAAPLLTPRSPARTKAVLEAKGQLIIKTKPHKCHYIHCVHTAVVAYRENTMEFPRRDSERFWLPAPFKLEAERNENMRRLKNISHSVKPTDEDLGEADEEDNEKVMRRRKREQHCLQVQFGGAGPPQVKLDPKASPKDKANDAIQLSSGSLINLKGVERPRKIDQAGPSSTKVPSGNPTSMVSSGNTSPTELPRSPTQMVVSRSPIRTVPPSDSNPEKSPRNPVTSSPKSSGVVRSVLSTASCSSDKPKICSSASPMAQSPDSSTSTSGASSTSPCTSASERCSTVICASRKLTPATLPPADIKVSVLSSEEHAKREKAAKMADANQIEGWAPLKGNTSNDPRDFKIWNFGGGTSVYRRRHKYKREISTTTESLDASLDHTRSNFLKLLQETDDCDCPPEGSNLPNQMTSAGANNSTTLPNVNIELNINVSFKKNDSYDVEMPEFIIKDDPKMDVETSVKYLSQEEIAEEDRKRALEQQLMRFPATRRETPDMTAPLRASMKETVSPGLVPEQSVATGEAKWLSPLAVKESLATGEAKRLSPIAPKQRDTSTGEAKWLSPALAENSPTVQRTSESKTTATSYLTTSLTSLKTEATPLGLATDMKNNEASKATDLPVITVEVDHVSIKDPRSLASKAFPKTGENTYPSEIDPTDTKMEDLLDFPVPSPYYDSLPDPMQTDGHDKRLQRRFKRCVRAALPPEFYGDPEGETRNHQIIPMNTEAAVINFPLVEATCTNAMSTDHQVQKKTLTPEDSECVCPRITSPFEVDNLRSLNIRAERKPEVREAESTTVSNTPTSVEPRKIFQTNIYLTAPLNDAMQQTSTENEISRSPATEAEKTSTVTSSSAASSSGGFFSFLGFGGKPDTTPASTVTGGGTVPRSEQTPSTTASSTTVTSTSSSTSESTSSETTSAGSLTSPTGLKVMEAEEMKSLVSVDTGNHTLHLNLTQYSEPVIVANGGGMLELSKQETKFEPDSYAVIYPPKIDEECEEQPSLASTDPASQLRMNSGGSLVASGYPMFGLLNMILPFYLHHIFVGWRYSENENDNNYDEIPGDLSKRIEDGQSPLEDSMETFPIRRAENTGIEFQDGVRDTEEEDTPRINLGHNVENTNPEDETTIRYEEVRLQRKRADENDVPGIG